MTILTPNMNLPEPVVGVESGPDWAEQLNNCLSIIDGHDHSSGYGVPVTPAGMNISTDLAMNINNLVLARSVRFSAQSAPLGLVTDLGCLYESGVDLYYNDGAGNQVRLTQSGGVAGSPGSIASLVSPASATYVSATSKFVWQSAANVAASLDARDLILRNSSASSFGVTVSVPVLGADYSLVLPTVPVSTSIMTLDNAGNMGASVTADNSTIEIASNSLKVKSAGITQTQMQVRSSGTTVGAGGFGISSSCGSFSIPTGAATAVTNFSVTITTLGNPVAIQVIPDGSANTSRIRMEIDSSSSVAVGWEIYRGATKIAVGGPGIQPTGSTENEIILTADVAAIKFFDVVAAGTYTYTLKMSRTSGVAASASLEYAKLTVFEMK